MTPSFRHDEVGMLAPPPLIFLVPIAAAWGVEWLVAFPIGGPASVRGLAGIVAVAIGFALGLAAVGWFVVCRTPVVPLTPTTTIVRTGPYRFTRNPMYLGFVVASIGIALLMNSWWVLVFLPVAIVAIDRGVIVREEQYLRNKFGAEYDEFARSVRRWI